MATVVVIEATIVSGLANVVVPATVVVTMATVLVVIIVLGNWVP
jgi:hypothetical protein